MAAAELTLDVPAKVTLEATGTNLREVVIPAGTRYLEFSSDEAWYLQMTGTDGAAGTATAQQRIGAGTSSLRAPGSGGGRARLSAARSVFLAGANAGVIWLTATSRSV